MGPVAGDYDHILVQDVCEQQNRSATRLQLSAARVARMGAESIDGQTRARIRLIEIVVILDVNVRVILEVEQRIVGLSGLLDQVVEDRENN